MTILKQDADCHPTKNPDGVAAVCPLRDGSLLILAVKDELAHINQLPT